MNPGRIFAAFFIGLAAYVVLRDISDAAMYSREAVGELRKLRMELHLTVCDECSQKLREASELTKGGLKIVP